MPLERVLEPEVMETAEEASAYDDMAHQEVNRAFVDALLAAGPVTGEVLDIGTGTGQIPVLLCKATEDVRVVGTDLSEEMLDLARFHIDSHGLFERFMLVKEDAKALPFEDGRFDVVMSNSIVHHIPKPAEVLAEAVRVCKPHGRLFFRDLARPESSDEVDRLVQLYASGETEHARKMFDDSLRAALTLEEMQAIIRELGLDADTVVASSDRHWTWAARKP